MNILRAYLKKSRGDHSISLPSLSIFNAPLKYFIVALCGFVVDFTIYAALVTASGSVYLANATGFCVGAIVNVFLIRSFVFSDSRFRLAPDIMLTILANGLMLLMGMAILWIQVDVLSVNPYWAKLVTNGSTFVLNYATRSTFFRK